MIKSTYKPYSLSSKSQSVNKKTYKVSRFLGVNYNKDTLVIGDNQSTEMKNLIYRDGVLQKRSGYENVGYLGDSIIDSINGFYKYVDKNKNLHKIFHIGTKLYEIEHLEKGSKFKDFKLTYKIDGLADHKSIGFVDKHKLYIIDGTKYRVLNINGGTWTLNDVYGSSDAFVPLTTEGISPTISAIDGRSALDDVNMLTPFRKNKLYVSQPIDTETTSTSNYPFEFRLDAPIVKKWQTDNKSLTNDDVTFDVEEYNVDSDDLSSILDSISFNSSNVSVDETTNNVTINSAAIAANAMINFSDGNLSIITPHFGAIQLDTTETSDGETNPTLFGASYKKYAIVTINNGTKTIIGYLDYSNKDYASIFLKAEGMAIVNAVKTIIVKFPKYNEKYEQIVNGFTIGTIFNNQLFLSGNSEHPNVDYHTEPINTQFLTEEEATSISDFTYISDLSYCAYGTDDTKVIGYDTYRDGDLIVFKEEKNNNATLYRRVKQLTNATDFQGNVITDSYEYIYPMYEINTFGGEGALSGGCITNFSGSTMYLTKNGLKVLSSKETTYNNARYSYDVSTNLNYRFKGKYASSDKLYSFKDRLFLITNDEIFTAFNGVATENELEWFPLDFGFIPETMFEIDDEIYFSYEKNIYRFNNNEYYYKDRTNIMVEALYYSDGKFYISKEYKKYLKKGVRVFFLTDDCEYVYRKLTYSPDENYQDLVVYKLVGGTFIETYVEIENDDFKYPYYVLLDDNYVVWIDDVSDVTIDNVVYTQIRLVDSWCFGDNSSISSSDIYGFANGETNLQIVSEECINAYYFTKPFNMGSSMYEKTLWGFTIINDSGLQSDTGVAYISNRKQRDIQTQVSSNGINLSEYNYEHFSFENDALPHIYTRYKVIPRVTFIKFAFQNSEESNMVLSELTLLYSVSRLTRGIK